MSATIGKYDVFDHMDPEDVNPAWVEKQFEEVLVAAIMADVPAESTRQAWENAMQTAIEECK